MAELLALIQSVGAPTAIAVLIILRIERRLDRLCSAVVDLTLEVKTWQSSTSFRPPASR